MRKALLAVPMLALATGTAVAAHEAPSTVDPGNFVRHVTNTYFPATPGTVWVYKGTKDGQAQKDRVDVTDRTRVILGVTTTVVHDVATQGGHVVEATFDYYAQDKHGNVWYFGEDTESYENGHVSTEGSWLAGRDGASPGIVMEGMPLPSDGYRQEFYQGHAEDMAWVLANSSRVKVPFGTFYPALKSLEWSRLEPGVIDEKDYGGNVGIIREISRTGPPETSYLVRFHRP